MIAFWLLPAEEAKAFFRSVIGELAARCGGPMFEPHLTLQGAEMEGERAIQVLQRIAVSASSLQLRIRGIKFSKKYAKTLFVQFETSPEAESVSAAFATAPGSGGYRFDPHLSLLYKKMEESEQAALARGIKIPFESVRFDALAAVSVPRAIKNASDVEAWRTLSERRLTGSSR